MNFHLNLPAYLQRIDYHGELKPTVNTLRALHRAHMLNVPFENLSIHAGEPIQLEEAWLFDKIVTRRRGGFCYELNGLFYCLLTELGFRVDRLSARVAHADGSFGPEFDHMALLVHLDELWLADVGFGASYLEPIRLNLQEVQTDAAGVFRIIAFEDGFVMQEWVDGKFESQHRFTLTPHLLSDYAEMCRYHQTSPASHFTQKIVCSQATLDGRLTLSGNRLIQTRQNEKKETLLDGTDEISTALLNYFGIRWSPKEQK